MPIAKAEIRTLTATATPAAMHALVTAWDRCRRESWVHPLIALAVFNLDFLCIHPFRDGNGRVSRVLLLSEIGLRTPGVNPGVKARSRRLQVFVRRFCYHVDMKIKLSAHGAYHHQYHVVWIPKYRKKVLKGELKQYLEKGLFDIETFHPDIEIETLSIQVDHIHLVIVIPPKYAVSEIVGKIKANTSREIRQRFPWIKKVYWRNEFWSVGFFSSTVGVNEDVIKRYVEFQEKVDTGKAQLDFGF